MKEKIKIEELIPKEYWNPIFLSFLFFMYIGSVIFFEPNKIENSILQTEIRIEDNLTLSEIADLLKEKKIIGNRFIFVLVGKVLGYERKIQTGIFIIPSGLSNYELYQQLINSEGIKTKRVTFIEGLTLRKMAKIASQNFYFTEEEFLAACSDTSLLRMFGIEGKTMEGFLMPDTYNFFISSKPKDIILKMAKEFDKFYKNNVQAYEKDVNLTKYEIVTLASVIQGETNNSEEKFIISGVYHNRLRKKMKLEACPTVKYLIGDRKKLYLRDYKINSPYNTYIYKGLPPGPVNNPDKISLLAAVKPQKHNYLFFVVSIDRPGRHTFSETFEQHQIAVRKYKNYEKSKKK